MRRTVRTDSFEPSARPVAVESTPWVALRGVRVGRAEGAGSAPRIYTDGVTDVLVTGADGFVGRTLCATLGGAGRKVRAAVRSGESRSVPSGEVVSVGSIGSDTDWRLALEGVEAVVHLAARVHVLRETSGVPRAEFHKVNALGTERLARAAADAGVKRLVYVSSVGVNGKDTASGFAFTEEHEPSPPNSYAISKWEAERMLHEVARRTDLEVVILRPPLIYGPGVKANFLRLMKLVDRSLPLPFGAVKNLRSLIYVGNLADVISRCTVAPEAAGETFLVSDGYDVSTPELIRLIGGALGRAPLLLPVPARAMRLAGRVTGTLSMMEPLLDSLVVDSRKVRRTLDWRPPYTMVRGLRETAEWFKDRTPARG